MKDDDAHASDLWELVSVQRYSELYLKHESPTFSYAPGSAIPTEITTAINSAQLRTRLGIWPAIGRAWAVVDCTLYTWDLSSSVTPTTTPFESPVVAVALVPAKPGVFLDHLRHAVIVATATEVIIHAAGVSDERGFEILPNAQLRVAISLGPRACIAGTSRGRVFFGGDDGVLYEGQYQSEAFGWFNPAYAKRVKHSGSLPIISWLGSLWNGTDQIGRASCRERV